MQVLREIQDSKRLIIAS
ncbi:DUF3967 domain-containing protein [Bacillus thuringiensis]